MTFSYASEESEASDSFRGAKGGQLDVKRCLSSACQMADELTQLIVGHLFDCFLYSIVNLKLQSRPK